MKPPEDFWEKLNGLPASRRECPPGARKALEQALPKSLSYKLVSRIAGTGSRATRFVAIAEWKGGCIAREAKAMVPPASTWIGDEHEGKSYYNEIIESAARAHDPFQRVIDGWLIRRLSPDSNPISISHWPKKRDEFNLLRSMGRETANVHVGSARQIKKILRHVEEMKATLAVGDGQADGQSGSERVEGIPGMSFRAAFIQRDAPVLLERTSFIVAATPSAALMASTVKPFLYAFPLDCFRLVDPSD